MKKQKAEEKIEQLNVEEKAEENLEENLNANQEQNNLSDDTTSNSQHEEPEKAANPDLEDEENDDKEERQFVVFQLDDQEYGIDIMQVHEIDRLKEIVISPVPKTPEFVEGIINLRGEVVPIIDLRKKLELSQKEIDKKSRILIVKIEKKMIGLLVDGVSEVLDVVEKDITLPPEEITDISTRYLSGVAKVGKRLVLLLNIDEIVLSEEQDESEK